MIVNINNLEVLNELQKELNINDEVLSYICAMCRDHGSVKVSKDLLKYIVAEGVGSEDLIIYDIEDIGTVLNTLNDPYVWDAQYLSYTGSIIVFSKDI